MTGEIHYRTFPMRLRVAGTHHRAAVDTMPARRYGGLPTRAAFNAGERERKRSRLIWGRALPWHEAQEIEMRDGRRVLESWSPGSVSITERPELMLRHRAHGGVRAGDTKLLIDRVDGLIMIAAVDTGRTGDAVLEIADEFGGEIGLSVGFDDRPWGWRSHDAGHLEGVERVSARILEIAITETPAFPSAKLWGRCSNQTLCDEKWQQDDLRSARLEQVDFELDVLTGRI